LTLLLVLQQLLGPRLHKLLLGCIWKQTKHMQRDHPRLQLLQKLASVLCYVNVAKVP
jgi:hypothetical protein